jgi:hypothetical protein
MVDKVWRKDKELEKEIFRARRSAAADAVLFQDEHGDSRSWQNLARPCDNISETGLANFISSSTRV